MTKRLVFDVELRRPACALLSAALGGDADTPLMFPSESWLTDLTPGLQVYEVDEKTFDRIVETVRKEHAP